MPAPMITLALQELQSELLGIRIEDGYRTTVSAVYRGRAALNVNRPLSGIVLCLHSLSDDPAEGNNPTMEHQEHIRSVVIEALVPISDAYDDELDAVLDDVRRVISVPMIVTPLDGYVLNIETGSVVFARPEVDIAAFQLPVKIGYFVDLSE